MIARKSRCRTPRLAAISTTWVGVVVLGSLWSAEARSQDSGVSGVQPIAEALLEAFNRHDPEAMASLVASDFELYYIDGEGVATLSIRGPDQLAEEMTTYFASRPEVRSTITGSIDGPVYVTFREQIVGGQSSLAVYEIRNHLIRRAWYFPAES